MDKLQEAIMRERRLSIKHFKSSLSPMIRYCFCSAYLDFDFSLPLYQPEHVPKWVINHGVVDGKTLRKLLEESKVS